MSMRSRLALGMGTLTACAGGGEGSVQNELHPIQELERFPREHETCDEDWYVYESNGEIQFVNPKPLTVDCRGEDHLAPDSTRDFIILTGGGGDVPACSDDDDLREWRTISHDRLSVTITLDEDDTIPVHIALMSNPNIVLPASPLALVQRVDEPMRFACELGGPWVSHQTPIVRGSHSMNFSVCLADGVNSLVIEGLPKSTKISASRGLVGLDKDDEGFARLSFSR